VEQNDVLIPTLTVRETLLYAAELRLPADQYTTQEKAERVDQIIETLGLTHCADTQV
jgi:ABC-type multidrug transport system ATPase subunit